MRGLHGGTTMDYITNEIWKHPAHKQAEKTPEYYKAIETLLYALYDKPYAGDKNLQPMEAIDDENE